MAVEDEPEKRKKMKAALARSSPASRRRILEEREGVIEEAQRSLGSDPLRRAAWHAQRQRNQLEARSL